MILLIAEYVTGGGLRAEPISAALLREGSLMLEALLRDLSEATDARLVVLRAAHLALPESSPSRVEWITLDPNDDFESCFRRCLESCDAAWPIAPETGGVLERLCQMAETAGKPLLTSPVAAVRIAASKLETVQRLAAHGIPVVPTALYDGSAPPAGFPVVVKPDDGVGCEGIRLVETLEAWRVMAKDKPTGRCVVQPWLEGEALSLSALFSHGSARLLSGNCQYLARENGKFILKGCGVNAAHDREGGFQRLAEHVAAALSELWGYAGIDLIQSDGNLQVLEINPRLTTSYAGLRAATGSNPAGMVLELWRHGSLPKRSVGSLKSVDIWLGPSNAD